MRNVALYLVFLSGMLIALLLYGGVGQTKVETPMIDTPTETPFVSFDAAVSGTVSAILTSEARGTPYVLPTPTAEFQTAVAGTVNAVLSGTPPVPMPTETPTSIATVTPTPMKVSTSTQ